MKRILSVFLFLVILSVFAGCQSNENGSDNSKGELTKENELNAFEYEDVSGGIEITKYTGSNTKVVVPEMIDNKKVVSVGTAFSGNLSLEEVELPSSVKDADFKNCAALKRLNAKGISYSGNLNLSGCESLEYLALPAITSLPNYDWRLPNSIRELVFSGITEFYLYQFPTSLSSLEVLDISGATIIRVDYHSWPSKLKEVKINNLITKHYISNDTGSVGVAFAAGAVDASEVLDITKSNESSVWCELFSSKEIIVNGVKHTKG